MLSNTPINETANRDFMFRKLSEVPGSWDVIVIGGGASGLGIALDAVSRGYKTVLLEQADFAKGTSSRSTKLVHGGVRYLAQGNIGLVREASVERGLLHKNAPHLVKNLSFIVPVYSLWDKIKYSAGLKLYDYIAGTFSLGASIFISKKETLQRIPGLKAEGLKGGVLYHDGQFDDSRLALNLAQSIQAAGGLVLNYTQVINLVKNEGKQLSGVEVIDIETGKTYIVPGKAVINATGVFVDQVLMMDEPGSPKSIRVSQGVHLVVDKSFYPANDALMIPETSDGRVLFAVPWHHHVVLGTTDTPVNEPSLEPQALEKEIAFILQTAGAYLDKKPTRGDVKSVFAGLRPLAASQGENQKTKEISRSHKIIVSASMLFTILGGKWTTYRKMGQDMINRVEKELGWPKRREGTSELHIHGYAKSMDWSDPFYFYGADAAAVRAGMNGCAQQWLSDSLKIHKAQVEWAVHNEMARTVEDVLSRRTRALFLDARESKRIAPQVASIMAKALGKSQAWAEEQVTEFDRLADQYILQ